MELEQTGQLPVRNAKCLCKKEDGIPCDYIGTTKSIGWHLRHKHLGAKQKIGVTFELTNKPPRFGLTSTGKQRKQYKKHAKEGTISSEGITVRQRLPYLDIPCVLRVNLLTGEQMVILGDNKRP
jgi:hypothetical protein